jgi:RNA polymerase sigma-70 factor (ECF subfamily)
MFEEASDAAIVERCRGGDVDAFGGLIERYQRPLYNAVLRKVWNREDAREVCQQTFLKAFEHLGSFDPNLKFFSWIYRIAMNEAINHLQARRPWESLDEGAPLAASEADPQQAFEALQRTHALHQALAALEEKYRSVLVLCHILQLSYRDAAEALAIEEKTVKSRLFSARQLLREHLEALGHAG